MSLINQVLNDLEKRGASTSIGEATIRVVPLRQQHVTFWVVVAVITVLALVGAWLKWGADMHLNTPQLAHNTTPSSASAEMGAASQVAAIATAEVPAVTTKPLVLLLPAIVSVNPNPAISLGMPQTVTIAGNRFAGDAQVTLRNPKGRVYVKRNIVTQNADQIVIRANFGSKTGSWSVEVVHANGDSSGEFTFTVLPAPVVASQQKQDKTALPATTNTRNLANAPNVAKQAPVEKPPATLADGYVAKQPTQITLQQQAENEFRKAYSLMQQGQTNAAISGYETVLQLDASHVVARQTLVHLLLENKRNADAERLLQAGLQLDPRQSSLAMLLARMQVGRNELQSALETMQKSLPYAEKLPDYQAFVAALLQRQNRHKEAITYFQYALQLNPKSGVWLMGLGISLRAEQRAEEARDAFNRALESRNLNTELQLFVKQQLKEL